jgi:hypothetical protein
MSPAEAVQIAWRRLCRAIDEDLSMEAARWAKVHAALTRLVSEATSPQPVAPPAPSSSPELEKVESNFAHSTSPTPIEGSPAPCGPPIDPRGGGP